MTVKEHVTGGARGRLRIWCALMVLLTIAGTASAQRALPAQKNWKRLQTPNFDVLGNAGDRDLRMVGERLELFRQAMSLLFGNATRDAATRTRVLVFRNHRDFDPFKPIYEGKPASLGGYFLNGTDVAHIALTIQNENTGFRLIQHEYVHLLMAESLGTLPSWVSEGLAEYYSTFTTTGDRRSVQLGVPLVSHVHHLQTSFMPLQTLVSATRDSEQYNERDKQGTFYAQSWALMHYLMLGKGQAYSPKVGAFVASLADGTGLADASREALGVESTQLEKELRAYVNGGQFMIQTARFDAQLARLETIPVVPVPEAEVHAALGDLLQRQRRTEEAEAHLGRALTLDAESPQAHAALAQVRVRQDRRDEALAHLERATASPEATFLTHYHLAALLANGTDAGDAARQEAALRRVVELNPRFAEGWHMLGALKGRDRASLADARGLVQKAIDLAPGQERYVLTMAYLHANSENRRAGMALARALVTQATEDHVRQSARTLLSRLEAYERQVAQATAASTASGLPPPPPPSTDTDGPADAPRLIPTFREVQGGEVRRFGYLVAIDCVPGGIVLNVDSDGRALAVKASRFEDVEFITYRDDLRGAVACGRREALDPIYLTWRGEPSVTGAASGTALAVEFLPLGFAVPRQDPLPE